MRGASNGTREKELSEQIVSLLQQVEVAVASGKGQVERISTPRTKTYQWKPRSGVAKG